MTTKKTKLQLAAEVKKLKREISRLKRELEADRKLLWSVVNDRDFEQRHHQ